MKRFRPLAARATGLFLTAVYALVAAAPLAATDFSATVPGPRDVPTASEANPAVTCTGANPALVASILEMADDTRQTLAPVLKLGRVWRYPVDITLVGPESPLAGKVVDERVVVRLDGKKLRLEAALPVDDPAAHEFVQRQFVTALLWEKFFGPTTVFSTQTRLDKVPFWLIEGLRESLDEDPDRDREQIVRRAALAGHAPTLQEVTGWQDLSDDRLLGLWQRVFCYYLVESLTRQEARLADFQNWLASITGPNPTTAAYLFPTEMGWQRELREASGRSRNVVYTWDESAAELAAAEVLALPKGKDAASTRVCTIETVGTFPRTKEVDAAIANKVTELTTLELRVHPSWRPVFALYRFGLTALMNHQDAAAQNYFRLAATQRAAEIEQRRKLVDYTNWFEVTKGPPTASRFQSYFQTAAEIDKVEPDPAHPNPMRVRLLQVEAEF